AVGGYVINSEVDELQAVEATYKAARFDTRQMVLTIAPNMSCNFACDYCFQGLDKPKGMMTQDVHNAVVRLVRLASRKIKRLGVAWYGGEPLIGIATIDGLSTEIMQICKAAGIQYSAMIVTNGYLMTAEVAKRLVAAQVETVQITLDGGQQDHDSRRILHSGRGTFDRIVENIAAVVDELPLRFSIRVNIDIRNAQGVAELIERLKSAGLSNRENLSVYFAPVESMTKECSDCAAICLTKSAYGKIETELYEMAVAAGVSKPSYPRSFAGICGAIKPLGFVILPTGEVHKCWDTVSRKERAIGSILDLENLIYWYEHMKWLRWTPFAHDACRACKLLPMCAGACAYKTVYPEDTTGAASLPCPSWKFNINERLVFMARQRGFVVEDDYDGESIKTDPLGLCAFPGNSVEV